VREGFFDFLQPSGAPLQPAHGPLRDSTTVSAATAWRWKRAWVGGLFRDVIGQHMLSLREFPPRQRGSSLMIETD
jgi:hypothetical protein